MMLSKEESHWLIEACAFKSRVRVKTRKDCQALSSIILKQTQNNISDSTLMRIFKLSSVDCGISPKCLDIIAAFLGYLSIAAFFEEKRSHADSPRSGLLKSRCLVSGDVPLGKYVEFWWNPDRRLKMRSVGGDSYLVTSVENSRNLQVGDKVRFSFALLNEPLKLNITERDGQEVDLFYTTGCGVSFSA